MLDLIASFPSRALRLIGRGFGFAIKIIFWPFVWAGRWYARRGWTLKMVLGAMLLTIIGLYVPRDNQGERRATIRVRMAPG